MKTLQKLRVILLLFSVVFTLICFIHLSGASLPYPDATQPLLDQQRRKIDFWNTWLLIGCCFTVFSIVFFVIVSIIKGKK